VAWFLPERFRDRAHGHTFRDQGRVGVRFFDGREVLTRSVFGELDQPDLLARELANDDRDFRETGRFRGTVTAGAADDLEGLLVPHFAHEERFEDADLFDTQGQLLELLRIEMFAGIRRGLHETREGYELRQGPTLGRACA